MDELSDAVNAIECGGTVIYPTETCYGIGCDATNPDAARQIYQIKQRSEAKKLTAIVADLPMAERHADLSEQERAICETLMPGPITLVTDKRRTIPDIVNHRFAFRIPDHKLCRQLSREAGTPIIATSANRSGNPSSYSINAIDATVRAQADVIIDEGTLEETPSSTVAELDGDEITIHREGPISKDQLAEVIR